ncbi:MAG: hypothetical protein LBQ65_07075, partial [Tannerellaceae bacterium]|nr:hypothetical protein [Tannerellaceae bacterium]
MKTYASLLIALGLLGGPLYAQEAPFLEHLYHYLENTALFELNQEEGRAYHIPGEHLSLNGDWKFFWSDTPEGIPRDFFREKFNDRAWARLPV